MIIDGADDKGAIFIDYWSNFYFAFLHGAASSPGVNMVKTTERKVYDVNTKYESNMACYQYQGIEMNITNCNGTGGHFYYGLYNRYYEYDIPAEFFAQQMPDNHAFDIARETL